MQAIHLPRSTYYYELGKKNLIVIRNSALIKKIKEIFKYHKGRYGVRRVHKELVNQGYKVNHKRVQRLMHMLGLFGKSPKKAYRSYKGTVGKIADNVIHGDFSTSGPQQKWTTDITQFSFSWGKCYLSPLLDMHTNEIIAYDLSTSPNMAQIKRMLSRAFKAYPNLKGLIFHSDQGWQYQHAYFREQLKARGIIQSMSRKGNCYDNSVMETFFGRMKNEMYYGQEKTYTSFEKFRKAVDEYVHYYNHERIQQKSKWLPPAKYRKLLME